MHVVPAIVAAFLLISCAILTKEITDDTNGISHYGGQLRSRDGSEIDSRLDASEAGGKGGYVKSHNRTVEGTNRSPSGNERKLRVDPPRNCPVGYRCRDGSTESSSIDIPGITGFLWLDDLHERLAVGPFRWGEGDASVERGARAGDNATGHTLLCSYSGPVLRRSAKELIIIALLCMTLIVVGSNPPRI